MKKILTKKFKKDIKVFGLELAADLLHQRIEIIYWEIIVKTIIK